MDEFLSLAAVDGVIAAAAVNRVAVGRPGDNAVFVLLLAARFVSAFDPVVFAIASQHVAMGRASQILDTDQAVAFRPAAGACSVAHIVGI